MDIITYFWMIDKFNDDWACLLHHRQQKRVIIKNISIKINTRFGGYTMQIT